VIAFRRADRRLPAVYFAAIGAGLLAIITVLSSLIHRRFRRSSSSSRSGSTPRSANGTPKTAGSTGTDYLGYPPTPPHITTAAYLTSGSPPSTGRLKKANSAPKRLVTSDDTALSPRGGLLGGGKEEPEMVMVTYEEGLKKLGLDRTHHILHTDAPSVSSDGTISTPHFSSLSQTQTSSSRPTPTTALLLTPERRPGYEKYYEDSPSKKEYPSSPSTGEPPMTLREYVGRGEGTGRFPTDSELMTTGVPSYYHNASHSRYRLEEGEL
jgi:hypothetical protein